MPPEKSAYALARYSRSPDSIFQSLEWVRGHDSQSFLEHYYFQYGHASIADLGHTIFCFEGISELAAIEIEDEPLWDGQAKSSRYQDFSPGGAITPPEIAGTDAEAGYAAAAQALVASYLELHKKALDYLMERHPRPEAMKPEPYRRALAARAYDVARYLLFLGIPTNIGQVTSIRTLEKQMRRLGASPYAEVREIRAEMAAACAAPPACVWDPAGAQEPLAPTLARHADPDLYSQQARRNTAAWAADNFPAKPEPAPVSVDLVRPTDTVEEIVATLLYAVTCLPFRAVYDQVSGWSAARKREVIDVALQGRPGHEELLREFRSGYAFVFDIVADIGAYRDLHRHRRCQQIRQDYTAELGEETPNLVREAGLEQIYRQALDASRIARDEVAAASPLAAHYLLPFASRARFLFKMDFAEAEYIARVRSGVKGHFSYRDIAWKIREKMLEAEPELGRLMEATPPWVEDTLKR
ncbi:MAG: FAD-dependent thymidylate synthase [Acidobacteria bacterium]|nr:FAD-dependent thymidylate synthase [Acidobacteriota bacterium]